MSVNPTVLVGFKIPVDHGGAYPKQFFFYFFRYVKTGLPVRLKIRHMPADNLGKVLAALATVKRPQLAQAGDYFIVIDPLALPVLPSLLTPTLVSGYHFYR
jgi:hypothetical protein